ncbi:MAG: 4Fe-4S binding protein [Clostridiales bacterium]|nr:4Fe-4S binding protein [Clostridiales bacterium]
MRRKIIQWLSFIVTNSYVPGFIRGTIYKGSLKQFCVPGLNCYSCPGAIASCPLGAIQAVLSDRKYAFSYYMLGLLLFFGLVFGRFICGFLCPFGLFQELLHKLPGPKIKHPWRWPRFIKYALLLVFVIILPLLMVNKFGMGAPDFCKYICPAGTLGAGLPLIALNPPLRAALGALFAWKMTIALAIVAGAIFIYRFFCRYLCPLGAIYGLFNRLSLYQLRCNKKNCIDCGLCQSNCKLGLNPAHHPNNAECIRCGDCVKTCPQGALAVNTENRREIMFS